MKTILLLLSLFMLIGNLQANNTVFTPEQEARIQKLIRETMVNNPDILEQAAQAWHQQSHDQAIADNNKALYENTNNPRIGAKNPKLTLVVFTDYNCPFCKRFDPSLEKIIEKYPNVAVIFKILPYKGETSVKAGRIAITTWRQQPEQFFSLHKNFMANRGSLNDVSIQQAQKKSNLAGILPDEQSMKTIQQDSQLAEQIGIQGTPATLIGKKILSGAVPYETLETAVKQQLADAS